MDAIIFLAPLSVFDEKLLEDSRVNRLQDSYELWKQVTSNKVLAHTQIILFLNKYDLLAKKLKRGVKVRDYISSYGERENTPEVAVKCTCPFPLSSRWGADASCIFLDFEAHFKEVHRKHSPLDRSFFVHITSVVVSARFVLPRGLVG
jgi:hypothetical protein